MEYLEKIPNGKMMVQVQPLPLILSISESLEAIYIIPKLMLILSFLELLLLIISNLLVMEQSIVSLLLMMNLITGLFVPLMEPQPLIGSVLFLKLLDCHVLKKEKVKKVKLLKN